MVYMLIWKVLATIDLQWQYKFFFSELIRNSDVDRKLKQIYRDMQAHIAFWFKPIQSHFFQSLSIIF